MPPPITTPPVVMPRSAMVAGLGAEELGEQVERAHRVRIGLRERGVGDRGVAVAACASHGLAGAPRRQKS